jgi:hypothetical protein
MTKLKNTTKTSMKSDQLLGVVINPKWNEITKNETVIALIKVRNNIENIINELDDKALLNYELWKISHP